MIDSIQIILLLVLIGLLLWQRKPLDKLLAPKTHKLILDTCALIDGRVIELTRSGFVSAELIVPEFVLHELQMLADGADAHKRERARFGLDVVRELQDNTYCTVTIDHTEFARQPNDDKLVELAIKLNVPLYTTDYNLNKLAEIKGVRVLNVNELAQNLRSVALPGERKSVKIIQKGSNPKQGVGYLEDGTMLVVDGGAKMVGKTAEVEITRVHQTVAGKMLFGELITRPQPAAQQPPSIARRMRNRTASK
jgi:uncharacterized protein YacL